MDGFNLVGSDTAERCADHHGTVVMSQLPQMKIPATWMRGPMGLIRSL